MDCGGTGLEGAGGGARHGLAVYQILAGDFDGSLGAGAWAPDAMGGLPGERGGGWEKKGVKLALSFREMLTGVSPWVVEELDRLIAQVNASWAIEHTDGGGHKAITATGSVTERGRSVALGEWTAVPYDAANFSGQGSMTWTVGSDDQNTYTWMLAGLTMTLAVSLGETSVGGTTDVELRVKIPGGYRPAASVITTAFIRDNGTYETGSCYVAPGAANLAFRRPGLANWTASANATQVAAVISFPVEA